MKASFPSAHVVSGATVTKTAPVPVTVTKPKRKPRPSDFQRLRLRVSLSVEACAELCGVTVRTIQNWDAKGAPLIAMRLLHIYDRQDLGGHGSEWRGWRFSRGKLICGRLSFHPRNLRQVPHYVDLVGRLEGARLRYRDGLPLHQVLSIVFDSPAFDALELLREPVSLLDASK